MGYEAENRAAIIAYFQNGVKDASKVGVLGVEVEHFVVHKDGMRPVPYEGQDGQIGVSDVLEHLRAFYPRETLGLHGEILGLANDEANLSLEPAAQLEISIAPFHDLDRIVEAYQHFRSLVDPYLASHGCLLVAQGYHPTAHALDLPLIPKQRYRFMNDYFHALGTHGERMMRATASTQVSVDYTSEADAVRKMRVAQACVVMLSSLVDNTLTFEGEPVTKPLTRLSIWRDVDNARCGSVPGLFDEGFGFAAYADWLLRTCPIFVTRPAAVDPQGPSLRSVAGLTAEQAYADAPMTKADIEHLGSMFWPDVRLKNFVEIRPADSLPLDLMAAYTALIKGLFYSAASLSAIEDAFGVCDGIWPLDDESTNQAIAAVCAQGLAAEIFGRTLVQWEQFLIGLAHDALDDADAHYLSILERLRPWA